MSRLLRLLAGKSVARLAPFSPGHLLVVQQRKRAALGEALARLTLVRALLWPLVLASVAFRWADLALTSGLIRSLLDESERPTGARR